MKGGQKIEDFPVIPIGMLSIWREQNADDDGDLDAMLQMGQQ